MMRAGEVPEGHRLRRWLADVRRLPRVDILRLGRLDRVATADQIAVLLDRPPHQTLVDAVFGRTAGNAYLTRLIVRDIPPDATSLPPNLPADLREAAAYAWQGLSRPARELTRLVAVAGGLQPAARLGQVATSLESGGDVVPLLREAVDAGVLVVGVDGTYWFAHPLLAEVLEDGLLPEERRAWHAAFAATLELPRTPDDEVNLEQVVDLADHYYRAGREREAYRWALRAADAAQRAGGAAEMLRLQRRALDLWPRVPHAGSSRGELLERIRAAAERAGAQEEELAAVEDLLVLMDRDTQPLVAADLLVRRMHLRLSTGRAFAALEDVREAVRLSARYPDSAEHALAIAELAHAELWHGEPSGPARAEEAVRLARACGSNKALAYALTANVMRRVIAWDGVGELEAEKAQAQEAQAAAGHVHDFGRSATLPCGPATVSMALQAGR
jgi:hypothetical protein